MDRIANRLTMNLQPATVAELTAAIRNIPDFPKPGIQFKDITPVLGDARLFAGCIDLLVGDLLIVELKACDDFAPIHTAQVISYLKATHKTLGLLINFNVKRMKDGVRRIAKTN